MVCFLCRRCSGTWACSTVSLHIFQLFGGWNTHFWLNIAVNCDPFSLCFSSLPKIREWELYNNIPEILDPKPKTEPGALPSCHFIRFTAHLCGSWILRGGRG